MVTSGGILRRHGSLGPKKCREYLMRLSDDLLLKKILAFAATHFQSV
jgi:hypothetical protein